MITRIKGQLVRKSEEYVYIDVGGLCYEIAVPCTVSRRIKEESGDQLELVTFYFFKMDKNRCLPTLIGFRDELERDFFLQFTGVSGIGPRAALRALEKPVPVIARAIEQGDVSLLRSLQGIGGQKAKQIVAHLQGKVGRFLLLKEEPQTEPPVGKSEFIEEARQVLKRLGYGLKESEAMIKKVLEKNPHVDTVEDFLNQVYYERR